MKKIEEFSFELSYNDEDQLYIISYISWGFIDIIRLFDEQEKIEITNIHAIIFDYSVDNDLYIKNDNISDIIGNIINLKSIVDFFTNLNFDFTINKLGFMIDEIEVSYDDDSQLVIVIPFKDIEKTDELLRKIVLIQQNNRM